MLKSDALPSAQICSQLTNRLERQQAAHREEFDSLKVRMTFPLWSSTVVPHAIILSFQFILNTSLQGLILQPVLKISSPISNAVNASVTSFSH